jgi:hypothetical protein
MTETEEDRHVAEAGDDRRPTDEIPSIVPDPEAPLRGEVVPDDWLDQPQTTPSGRPGASGIASPRA